MDSADILLIILSSVLAIFLILGIVLVSILIKVARQLKRITSSAERTVGYLEDAASAIPKVIGPALITKLFSSFINKAKGSKEEK